MADADSKQRMSAETLADAVLALAAQAMRDTNALRDATARMQGSATSLAADEHALRDVVRNSAAVRALAMQMMRSGMGDAASEVQTLVQRVLHVAELVAREAAD